MENVNAQVDALIHTGVLRRLLAPWGRGAPLILALDDSSQDMKREYRDGETDAKAAWRRSDGDESLADKAGNAGDEKAEVLLNLLDARPEAQTYDVSVPSLPATK